MTGSLINRRLLPLPMIAALLTGCATTGGSYRVPAVDAPPAFAAQPAGMTSTAVEARWWQVFADPVLDGLITRALDANPDARIALARVKEARALAGVARSDRLPSGSAGAAYQRRRLADFQRLGVLPRTVDQFSASAEVGWELDLFGRVQRSVDAAEAELGGAGALLAASRVTVMADVASRYVDLRTAQAQLRLADAARANAARILDMARHQAEAGTGSALDVLAAESRLREVSAAVPTHVRDVAVARHALAVLLGEAPQAFSVPDASQQAPIVQQVAVGTPAELLRRRPDIRAAERALAATSARAGMARAELFPRLGITGFIGLLAGGIGNLFTGGALAMSAGPTMSWSLFDLPRLKSQVGAADARTEAALIVYHRTVLDALRETEDALVSLGAVQAMLQQQSARVAASREALRLMTARFAEGEGERVDVLAAEGALIEAQAALSAVQAQHHQAVIAVHRALGGGWDPAAKRTVAGV